jgi:hypothetical protein
VHRTVDMPPDFVVLEKITALGELSTAASVESFSVQTAFLSPKQAGHIFSRNQLYDKSAPPAYIT